jgi:hypothetical protein
MRLGLRERRLLLRESPANSKIVVLRLVGPRACALRHDLAHVLI